MPKPAPSPAAEFPPCGLLRRLAVILYDALLLLAVIFIAGVVVLPLTEGEAVRAGNPLYTSYIFFVSFFFYGWFWTHGGQTLGMRAWRVRVQNYQGHGISWYQALLRFLVAIPSWAVLGLGFWWSMFEPRKRTWHDLYSESVLVVLPKK